MTDSKRRITRDPCLHKAALEAISRRVDREQTRHIEALSELEAERAYYIEQLDADTRTKLEAMGVIGASS